MGNIIDKIRPVANNVKTFFQNISRQIARLNSKPNYLHPGTQGDEDKPAGAAIQTSRQYKPANGKKTRPIRRNGRQRVYRLKGYTTVAKVNRKRQSERQQRLLRRLLIIIIFVLTLFLLFNLYNPVKDLTEWYRIIGINELTDLTASTTSASPSGSATAGSSAAADNQTTESGESTTSK